jgi:hypothetical protein
LRAHVQREADERDFRQLTSEIQSRLPAHLPPDYAEAELWSLAARNPALVAAFDYRNVDPRAADTELRKVEAALQHLGRDPTANPQEVTQLTQLGHRLGLALNAKKIIDRAKSEVLMRANSVKPIDPAATEIHDVVAAAVRGASGKISPEPPPAFGNMSDKELSRYTKEHFGF